MADRPWHHHAIKVQGTGAGVRGVLWDASRLSPLLWHITGEKICGRLIQVPFADDKVIFLVTEVENSCWWPAALPQEAPGGQVPQLGPEACWQTGIVPWGYWAGEGRDVIRQSWSVWVGTRGELGAGATGQGPPGTEPMFIPKAV